MSYRHFNRSVSAAAFTGVVVLLFTVGCYKADTKRDVLTAQSAEYKGGASAWLRFLNANCKYPDAAIDGEISGTVRVKFIVEQDGTVSGVQALSGPEILQTEAERVIRLSNQWEPATSNGHKERAYTIQPIVFRLAQE